MFKKYINENKDSFFKDLFKLISFDTVLREQAEVKEAPFGYGMVECLNWVLKLGEEMGFKTKNVENVAGHIEFGEGEEILGILAHLDVVPTGEGWTNDPFVATVRDDKIYARGVNDDKGPLMECLYAMKILKDSGFKPSKRIRLIMGTDEESGSRGIKRYLELEETPTIGFSPDAEFPLIYAEKGIMSLNIVSKEKDLDIVSIRSGDRYNVVPEKAFAKLNKDLSKEFNEYLNERAYEGEVKDELCAYGKRAHAMEPKNGVNAMLRLFNFLTLHLDNKLVKFVSKYLNDSRFNDIDLAYSHNEMGDLTMNVAVCDINENGGFVGLNLRYPINWDKEHFFEVLRKHASEYNLDVQLISDSLPLYVNPEGELIEKLHKAYIDVTGDDVTPLQTIGGGTYARSMKNAVAFGAAFPGREEVAHNVDEYMYIEDLFKGMEVYIQAIKYLG